MKDDHVAYSSLIKNYNFSENSYGVAWFRGKVRVYERKLKWDDEKNDTYETREYIGYVIDGCYYSNADYQKLIKPRSCGRGIH